MSNLICGEIMYNNVEYKFDFRDNILVLVPSKLESFSETILKFLNNDIVSEEYINLEGITNQNKYICFMHIRLSDIGRGVLKSFVPGYVMSVGNNIFPIQRCIEIEKIRFYGECFDSFYYPKRIIDYSDLITKNEKNFKIIKEKQKTEDYIVNKDRFSFGVYWRAPQSSNINIVLDVSSYLEITFDEKKDVSQILNYYLNLKKFFSFINNRKYIKFDKIFAYKNIEIKSDDENKKRQEIKFEFFFTNPKEKIDIRSSLYTIHLEDLNNKFSKLYKEIIKKDYLIHYYPLSISDSNYIDNDKYISVASAFESEFDKQNPKFKSDTSIAYIESKKFILKSISNKKSRLKKNIENASPAEKKQLKSMIKNYDYFYKVIKEKEGTLEDKIVYSYKKYNNIISRKKEMLFYDFNIKPVKYGKLASSFITRRNDIAHGRGNREFNVFEIISYELLRICIYCITLERCKFNFDEIENIINKLF